MDRTSTHRVAVIIATYNRAHLLGETLDSLLLQTEQDFEAVVVDDGGTDETEAVVAHYGPLVRYIRQDHAGCSAARNRGISETTAPHILLLDDDDLLDACALSDLAQALDRHPEAGLAYGDFDEFGEGSIDRTFFAHYPPADGMIGAKVLKQFSLTAICSVMFRRSGLETVGLFDERMGMAGAEDVELCMRFCAHYPAVSVRRVVSHVRATATSKHRNPSNIVECFEKREEAVERFIDAHPEVAAGLSRFDLMQTRARPSFDAGVWALRRHERARARRLLRRFLALCKTYPQGYWYYFLSFMPWRVIHRFAGRIEPVGDEVRGGGEGDTAGLREANGQ